MSKCYKCGDQWTNENKIETPLVCPKCSEPAPASGSEGLKPCPFCNCMPVHGVECDIEGWPVKIKCPDCPCVMLFYSSNKQQAIEAWNRRLL